MNRSIDFESTPLVPAVVQDDVSRDVLMVGFMNQLAFERTLETGFVHFWSRSRNRLWKKGETSGHTQEVVSMAVNCENNSLLIQVLQKGAVCHTGHRTCYYRQVLPDGSLFETSDPAFNPSTIYPPQVHRDASASRHKKGLIELWYGAYEYLRDHDLTEVSNTSRLLHGELISLGRIADELDELAGVLAGEHAHSGDLEQDAILEGSQVFYWLTICSVSLGLEWDRQSGLQELPVPESRPLSTEQVIVELRHSATEWRESEKRRLGTENDLAEDLSGDLKRSYQSVAQALKVVARDPMRAIERDLSELESRAYLVDYFSSAWD